MILCCGEALIDMIPRPTEDGGQGFVPYSGGAIFNTAMALGRLGNNVGFLTGLSTDLFGEQLTRDLAASHVDTSYALRADLPTTLAFVRLQNGHATYTFYDENTAGRSLSPEQVPELPEKIQALYFGGISLISEPCADFYAALAVRESGDRTIVLDPNIRPGFISDEARYRARLDKMVAIADILKVSDEDLDWIVSGDGGLEAKAASLLGKGPRLLIVTKGSEGATGFLQGGDQVNVPAPKTTVVDTVGAGDTFNAGFLSSLAVHQTISKEHIPNLDIATVQEALKKGAAVAAVTVSRAGANPPWAEELEPIGRAQ